MRLGVTVLLLLSVPLFAADPVADEEPPALTKAREKYQKDILPITKAYLATLEGLKKQLGAKGDLKAAQAVQEEIDVVKPEKAGGDKSIMGKWHARYPGNRHCIYTFTKGKVTAENSERVLMTGTWTMTGSVCTITTDSGSRETWTAAGPGKFNLVNSNDSAACTRQ